MLYTYRTDAHMKDVRKVPDVTLCDYRILRQTNANTRTRSTHMAVSRRIGGRAGLLVIISWDWSMIGFGVCALDSRPSACAGVRMRERICPLGSEGAGGAGGGDGWGKGLDGIMMDAASIGRTGFGASRGGVCSPGSG